MGKGMTMISTSQARLMPPRAKYIDSVSIQVPSMLLSHSAMDSVSNTVVLQWLLWTHALL